MYGRSRRITQKKESAISPPGRSASHSSVKTEETLRQRRTSGARLFDIGYREGDPSTNGTALFATCMESRAGNTALLRFQQMLQRCNPCNFRIPVCIKHTCLQSPTSASTLLLVRLNFLPHPRNHVRSTTGILERHSVIFLVSRPSETTQLFPRLTSTSTPDINQRYIHRQHCTRCMYGKPVHKKAPQTLLTYTCNTSRHNKTSCTQTSKTSRHKTHEFQPERFGTVT